MFLKRFTEEKTREVIESFSIREELAIKVAEHGMRILEEKYDQYSKVYKKSLFNWKPKLSFEDFISKLEMYSYRMYLHTEGKHKLVYAPYLKDASTINQTHFTKFGVSPFSSDELIVLLTYFEESYYVLNEHALKRTSDYLEILTEYSEIPFRPEEADIKIFKTVQEHIKSFKTALFWMK